MSVSQKRRIMEALHCSEAEAELIMADDKKIDRGEKMDFDLSPEKEKEAKKYARTGTRKSPTVYKFDTSKRTRKENPTKASIISELAKFLEHDSENACVEVNITNKERQIAFRIGDNSYELTLVQKRKPK